ncbi:hypothetical protein BJ138DRAFT_1144785 [Hygrophoropsis aurantiaca]|uniref:Uncharacterized protein n=1 Tax=Hygrophoropsis aurantiaca TaxID=72124 RepID=A0ACB8AMI3_9AGAM|nr:hypothetical protein BJ138DRAFT_1144785 [Hygrophoropsis aurantiaca]
MLHKLCTMSKHLKSKSWTVPPVENAKLAVANALLNPEQLKGHLLILNAFHQLKLSIEETSDDHFPRNGQALDNSQRWAWFVSFAVERFERWCSSLPLELSEERLPPLDVVMVWHAYLLNPIQVYFVTILTTLS